MSPGAVRIGIVADYPDEGWPSMDLCAEMLLAHLSDDWLPNWATPRFRRRFTRLPGLGRRGIAFNADRLLNRHFDLPRHLRRRAGDFDLFHVVDHSYAQVVHALPADRTGVYCHDLDAFRCLLDPAAEPRPGWFRILARRTLTGLQRAALVFHNSVEIGRRLTELGLVEAERLRHAPLGVAEEFTPDPQPTAAPAWLADWGIAPWLLHVGSCIRRKRVDVLLEVFARLRMARPDLRLVQVGGTWAPAHVELIDRLGVGPALVQVRGLSRAVLAELYRRAALVLVTSEAEGFGLPVIEALACGAPVLASDLPVLREVGGDAARYCPVADVTAWAETAGRLLDDPATAPPRELRLHQAAKYTWAEHARIIATAYRDLLGA